jgi:hypothetical protein
MASLCLEAQNTTPKIYFIYNASGTIGGEISYLYGKYFQNQHCELCDITHSSVSAKPEWKAWIRGLKCENHVLHTNEAEEMGIDFSEFVLPVVLIERGHGLEELISKKDMAQSGKRVDAFSQLFFKKLNEFGLECK